MFPNVMNKVRLKLKTFLTSYFSEQESLSKLSVKVLGNIHDPVKDNIGLNFVYKVNTDHILKDVEGFIKSPQIWFSS